MELIMNLVVKPNQPGTQVWNMLSCWASLAHRNSTNVSEPDACGPGYAPVMWEGVKSTWIVKLVRVLSRLMWETATVICCSNGCNHTLR